MDGLTLSLGKSFSSNGEVVYPDNTDISLFMFTLNVSINANENYIYSEDLRYINYITVKILNSDKEYDIPTNIIIEDKDDDFFYNNDLQRNGSSGIEVNLWRHPFSPEFTLNKILAKSELTFEELTIHPFSAEEPNIYVYDLDLENLSRSIDLKTQYMYTVHLEENDYPFYGESIWIEGVFNDEETPSSFHIYDYRNYDMMSLNLIIYDYMEENLT